MDMDLEECYDICREYSALLKKNGVNAERRRWVVSYCRRRCRDKGYPSIGILVLHFISNH